MTHRPIGMPGPSVGDVSATKCVSKTRRTTRLIRLGRAGASRRDARPGARTRTGRPVERLLDGWDKRGIVDEDAGSADEEVAGACHFQVVDQLPWLRGRRRSPGPFLPPVSGGRLARAPASSSSSCLTARTGGCRWRRSARRCRAPRSGPRMGGYGILRGPAGRRALQWRCPGSRPGHRSSASRWRGGPLG